jgi:mannose-6-phosphate isomerase-like protein (cupin superfamily)
MTGNAREIETQEARAKGVWTQHSEMPSGELRFRLRHDDGTGYSRTEAGDSGGWQTSHHHHSVRETYITQRGRMAFAELIDGGLRIRLFGPGEICTTEPKVPHNVYLYRNTVIHTVKHGDEGSVADWHAEPSLDEKTRHLNEADIARLAATAIPTSNLRRHHALIARWRPRHPLPRQGGRI